MNYHKTLYVARIWVMAIAATYYSTPASLATDAAVQKVPTQFPLAIVCWNQRTEGWLYAYLAGVAKDGTATYIPQGGKGSGTVTANGPVMASKHRPTVYDCFGKTIDELRSMGRAIEAEQKR
ncbi:hypothetical protein [Rhizobium leguminosarum]|uniref:Uncharacterized protein n=1 Tax=Rhizobium leguminosarum TaxID=384 RepID=A0A2Z4YVX2_RHILE|nr:hypothetical protein [Rhizobium leguminosarum]AXA44263.1 hypothetical protein DLJ82_6292 [Rhizobium leguminosarum]